MAPVKLAIVGAGLIGKRHAEHVAREPGALLSAIVDPSDGGRELAQRLGTRWYRSFAELVETGVDGGVAAMGSVLATTGRWEGKITRRSPRVEARVLEVRAKVRRDRGKRGRLTRTVNPFKDDEPARRHLVRPGAGDFHVAVGLSPATA